MKEPRKRWRWLLLVALAIAGIVVFVFVSREKKAQAAKATAAKAAAQREIPVSAATARTGDLGVYVNGLGTVTAVNTVTIRSRVDGQLIDVGYREGQLVHQGDVLAQIDARPFQVQLLQAEGQLAKDQAALANAKLDLQRYQALMKEDSIPRQQLDTQMATVNQDEAVIKSDEAQIESAKLNLTYSRITAPISGRIGLRLVDAGNIVHASDPNGLLVITQLQPITVLFNIPADRLPAVMKQMRGGQTLAVDTYDRDMKSRLAVGSLLAVDNQIDPTTGTVKLKAAFPNESFELFPNQFVNARLLVDTLRSVVIVPAAAIQRSPQSTFVFVVKPDKTVDMRNVEVQLTEGDQVATKSGVAAGDVVVVDGVDKLQPGTKVAVATPGAKGEGQGEARTPEGQTGKKEKTKSKAKA